MRARKIDSNQAQIVAALRALGIGVIPINSQVDLVVGHKNRSYIFELKDPAKAHRESSIKPSQKKLRDAWPGQYSIVSTLDEVLAVIGWEGPPMT